MATAKKASKSGAKSEKKADPFKTRKTTSPHKADDIVTPPEEISEAIDAFRQASDQAKFFEGEATVYKNSIVDYARSVFSKRFLNGTKTGFKIRGSETDVMYVIQDSSAGFSEEEVQEFENRWGRQAAEELIVRDLGNIRFNEKVLEAHYDEVVQALQTLPDEVFHNLFKPMLMKAKPGALESARKYAKSSSELEKLVRDLKIKNYIK